MNEASQTQALLNDSSTSERARWQHDLIPLYRDTLQQNLTISFSEPKRHAITQLNLLRTLYPENEQVNALSQEFALQQQQALEQTALFVAKFSEIRTKMANIALLAKRGKWAELEKQTKSLEEFAVSYHRFMVELTMCKASLNRAMSQMPRKSLRSSNKG